MKARRTLLRLSAVLMVAAMIMMAAAPLTVLARPPMPGINDRSLTRLENLPSSPAAGVQALGEGRARLYRDPDVPNPRAAARLKRVKSGPQRLRIRGHASEVAFAAARPRVRAVVNGLAVGASELDRPGLFVLEADPPDAAEYEIVIEAQPVWRAPGDARDLTVNLSMVRLVERNS